jgi:serine phosphatase RsbU (regulator of sigma subunit)
MNRPLPERSNPDLPRRLVSVDYMRALKRLDALSRMASHLAAVQTERELGDRVTAGLRGLFPQARVVEMFLSDAAGNRLHPRVGAAPQGSLDALLAGTGARPTPSLTTLMPYLVTPNLVPANPREGRGPMLSAPLVDSKRLLGLLLIEGERETPDFTIGDLDALTTLAAQVSMVLQRLRVEQQAAEQRRMASDLTLARQIQRKFLPTLPPQVLDFRVAAEYRPAYAVGGDFYDVVPSANGHVMAVVGDVSGKGVAAALVMSRVSSEFRRLAQMTDSPQELLTQLNHSMVEQSPDDTFVTAACLRLHGCERTLRCANAGHLLPLLRRKAGQVAPIGRASGPPLGMLPWQAYVDQEFEIDDGDIVLLMTDGVAEALQSEGDPFGVTALRGLVAAAPHDVDAINSAIMAAVDTRGARRADDVTLLALELQGRSRELAA